MREAVRYSIIVRYSIVGAMAAAILGAAYYLKPSPRFVEQIREERKVNAHINAFGFKGINDYLESGGIQDRNVLGGEAPESFIDLGGVRYYSHIDGKDISDLVCE